MANFNYLVIEPMPDNRTIPCSFTLTDDSYIFGFESDFSDLDILDDISVDINYYVERISQHYSYSHGWFWSNTLDGPYNNTNSTYDDRTTDMAQLKNLWAKTKPYLMFRIGISGTARIYLNSFTVTASGRSTKPVVTAGDLITKEQMDALREYKFNVPTEVTRNTPITATIGITYNAGITQNSLI